MRINNRILLLTLLQTFVSETIWAKENSTENCLEQNRGSKLLSRRKRFLIFPDGSSLQLVFCTQTSALIPIGDIFLFGSTAALAWSLPTDPKLFHMLKGYDQDAVRRGDLRNHVYYIDDKGTLLGRVPFKQKPVVRPVYTKRSISKVSFKNKLKTKIDRMKMHEKQKTREFLKKDHLAMDTIDYHRTTRVELFEKVEKLLTAVGRDGRQCVLHKLCEAARAPPRQDAFLKELLRVIFTLPKGTEFDNEDHREYDIAHNPTEDCRKKYPGCKDFQLFNNTPKYTYN